MFRDVPSTELPADAFAGEGIGMVDLVAHLGPTGLVVGGIAAYVASQHGPELANRVREALPSPAPLATKQAGKAHTPRRNGGGRSLLDRALGRFPEQEAMRLEEVDTVIVDAPETTAEPSGQTKQPTTQLAHPLFLAPDLTLEANDIVGAGINIFGVKGSGKTVTTIRLPEQFARWRGDLLDQYARSRAVARLRSGV